MDTQKTINLKQNNVFQRETVDTDQIERATSLVEMIEDLPPFPKTTALVMKLLENPDTPLTQLADSVNLDPALASRILRIANSPIFFRGTHASTVLQALSMLGLAKTKALVTAANLDSLRVSYSGEQKEFLTQSQDEIWRNSLCTAIAAHELATTFRKSDPDELFIAGLLHDLGKCAFMYLLPSKYAALLRSLEPEHSLLEAEARELGFTHPMVGTFVAQHWLLPIDICEIIRLHHEDLKAPFRTSLYERAALVTLANLIAHAIGHGYRAMSPGLSTELGQAANQFQLDSTQLNVIVERVSERFNSQGSLDS